MLRIYVDFNTAIADPEDRVFINLQFLPDLAMKLQPGAVVKLLDETLEVEAIIEFDEQSQSWLGRPHWATRVDLPS